MSLLNGEVDEAGTPGTPVVRSDFEEAVSDSYVGTVYPRSEIRSFVARAVVEYEFPEDLRCVIIGDGCTGKTCLANRVSENKWYDDYVPTVFDSFSLKFSLSSRDFSVTLWDPTGGEDSDQLELLGSAADVVVLCFSVVDRHSADHVRDRWLVETLKAAPTAAVVLCVTKLDLREDEEFLRMERVEPLSKEFCDELTRELGLSWVVETSSMLGTVGNLLPTIVAAFWEKRNGVTAPSRGKKCGIM